MPSGHSINTAVVPRQPSVQALRTPLQGRRAPMSSASFPTSAAACSSAIAGGLDPKPTEFDIEDVPGPSKSSQVTMQRPQMSGSDIVVPAAALPEPPTWGLEQPDAVDAMEV